MANEQLTFMKDILVLNEIAFSVSCDAGYGRNFQQNEIKAFTDCLHRVRSCETYQWLINNGPDLVGSIEGMATLVTKMLVEHKDYMTNDYEDYTSFQDMIEQMFDVLSPLEDCDGDNTLDYLFIDMHGFYHTSMRIIGECYKRTIQTDYMEAMVKDMRSYACKVASSNELDGTRRGYVMDYAFDVIECAERVEADDHLETSLRDDVRYWAMGLSKKFFEDFMVNYPEE